MARPHATSGTARLLRGWSAALIATLVAAGSHTLAGPGHHDDGPSPAVLILTLALAGPLCTALAGRVLSWRHQCAAVVLSQGLFHALYSLGPGAAPAAVGHGAGHEHHIHQLTVATVGQSTAAPVEPVMLLAHLWAAVVTIALLRQGERAVLTAYDWLLRRPELHLTPVLLPAAYGLRRAAWHQTPALRSFLDVMTTLQWRGPPRASLCS